MKKSKPVNHRKSGKNGFMGLKLPYHENKSLDEDIDDSESEKFEINTG